MNKVSRNGLIAMGVILLLLLLWFISSQKERYFNEITLEKVNYINNKHNDRKYLDTIVSVGLTELNLKGIVVVIKYVSKDDSDKFPSGELKGTLYGNGNQYIMGVGKVSRDEAITIVAHELIHLTQNHSGKLRITKTKVYWNGKEIDPKLPYSERPWEIDAFDKGIDLESKMRPILY